MGTHEIYENRAVFEKMRGKIRSCDCAFFKLTYFPKGKNKLLWLKCLLNVIIKRQLSFFGGVVRLPPYKNERHQLVTFTDGSDMYIHFKVLYIAVMLGIVQQFDTISTYLLMYNIVYIHITYLY